MLLNVIRQWDSRRCACALWQPPRGRLAARSLRICSDHEPGAAVGVGWAERGIFAEWRLRGVTVDGSGGAEHDAVNLRALHGRDECERVVRF